MRRALAAVALAAAATVAPCASADGDHEAYALVSTGTTADLVELDPTSLQPTSTRSVPVGRHDLPWARSPDGSKVLIGSGRDTTLLAVDLEHLRPLREIPLRGMAYALAWPTPHRALAVVPGRCCPALLSLLSVDPDAGRIVARAPLGAGTLISVGQIPRGLVLLMGGSTRIRPARLLVARADGSVRRIDVRGIPAGYRSVVGAAGTPVARNRRPGLAVDPAGRRAFVVGPRAVALVDLRSGGVAYHALRERSLAACLDGCGLSEGSYRSASWVSRGRLAISGYDDRLVGKGQHQQQVSTPYGLRLLSTRTWTLRTLDDVSSAFTVAGGVVLGYGSVWIARTGATTTGLRGYGLDGRRRFATLGTLSIGAVSTLGRLAYVGLNDGYRSHAVQVIDLRRGRVVGRPEVRGALFLVGDTPGTCWC